MYILRVEADDTFSSIASSFLILSLII